MEGRGKPFVKENKMKEQNIQWNDFDRLSHEIGVVLPSSRISVKSTEQKTVIKPSWRRWLPVMCFLLIALLPVVPLIINYLIIPETSPKRPEMTSKEMLLAIFSLLFFWLAFRHMLRYGKISWQLDSSELVVHYGNLLFPQKISISRKGLAVKIYVYKADRPNIRAKYGMTVLSLVRNEQEDNELIIGLLRDEKTAISAYHKLKDFIGQGIDEISTGEPASPSDALPLNIETANWNELVKSTLTWSPFFGSGRFKDISVKASDYEIVLKWNWKRWVISLFLLVFGCFMYWGAYQVFRPNFPGVIFCLMGLGLGTLFTYPALKIILSAQKLTLSNLNSSIVFRHGFFPFPKTLTIAAEQITARIYRCESSSANRAVKPGYTILSLLNKKSPNSELILVASSKKLIITPLYEKFVEFLNQPYSDELMEKIELPSGEKIQVSTESLTGGGDSQDRKRSFHILSSNLAVFSRNWTGIITGCALAALMSVATVVIVSFNDEGEKQPIGEDIFFAILGLIFVLLGGGFAVYSWQTRHIFADKKANAISYRSLVKSYIKGKLLCTISDIAAVQVCSILGTIASGRSFTEVTVYEINVVLKNSDNKRINIMAGQNCPQIRKDADQFAEFLGVPVLDHTQEVVE
ncbi:MAG: hypothetical protein ACYS0I_04660 [Planctomycetota bacterium]|jgi:hypothetical protein